MGLSFKCKIELNILLNKSHPADEIFFVLFYKTAMLGKTIFFVVLVKDYLK